MSARKPSRNRLDCRLIESANRALNDRINLDHLRAECFDVKLDRRYYVSKGFLACVALAHNNTPDPWRISYIAIRVLFNDNAQVFVHIELPMDVPVLSSIAG